MAPSSAFPARHPGRTLLGVAVPPASLPAHSLVAPALCAANGGYRSEPVLTLCNGDARNRRTFATDTDDDVQPVNDTLHAPAGTWVTSEIHPSILGPHDTFHFYADEPPSTCRADPKVDTPTPQSPVVAATDPVGVNGTVLSTAAASGQSRQTLWMNVSG